LASSNPDQGPQPHAHLILFSIPVIQPPYFQQLPGSFAQWTLPKSFPFNPLRTLSIAMGVYPPLGIFIDCLVSNLHDFPSAIAFLFNRLQNALPATSLL
jgi:hypothetical protein